MFGSYSSLSLFFDQNYQLTNRFVFKNERNIKIFGTSLFLTSSYVKKVDGVGDGTLFVINNLIFRP